MAGREVLPVGLHHDDPDSRSAAAAIIDVVQLVEHRRRLRVRLVGPVQRDHADAVVDHLVQDCWFVAHAQIRSMMMAGAMPPAAHIVIRP